MLRFAPSPTGDMHIGNLRVALFNYIVSKQKKEDLIVRIEDTDKERSKVEYKEQIVQSLKWIGIEPDKDEYIRSTKIKKHIDITKELLKKGYIVYLTRDGDYFIPLKERTHFANMKKADLFISIHCNIAPKHLKSPNGIETYFLSPTRNERAIQVARLENKEIKNLNYLDQRVILNFLNKALHHHMHAEFLIQCFPHSFGLSRIW